MKNIFITILCTMVIVPSAYATKARLLALGQSKDDNYYVQDSRSIFLNAAFANNFADTLSFEWGTSGNGLGIDTNDTPKAMGGFLKTAGNFVYGAHLGNESDTGILLRGSASGTDYATANQLADTDNVVDFFFAGRGMNDLKWGTNFLYSKSRTESTVATTTASKSKTMAGRLGVLGNNWEAYANIGLGNTSERSQTTNKAKFEGNLGYHLGGSYDLGPNKVAASFKSLEWDQTFNSVKTPGKLTVAHIGIHHSEEISADSTIFAQVSYTLTKLDIKFTGTPAEIKHSVVPMVVGFETKVTDWLIWRGSFSANLLGNVEEKGLASGNFAPTYRGVIGAKFGTPTSSTTGTHKQTIQKSIKVNGGASLIFGEFTVDGMLGLYDNSRSAGQENSTAGDTKDGVLTLDTLLARVGMTYNF